MVLFNFFVNAASLTALNKSLYDEYSRHTMLIYPDIGMPHYMLSGSSAFGANFYHCSHLVKQLTNRNMKFENVFFNLCGINDHEFKGRKRFLQNLTWTLKE